MPGVAAATAERTLSSSPDSLGRLRAAGPARGGAGPNPFTSLFGVAFRGGRIQDGMLALLAVAVICLMVLPLPTPLLDALIAINIGLSILLMMLAMYVPTPLGLSTFPTLLLFTTLLRLSLSIASARLILLNADAGEIIDTFGNLVVGGNVVVGIVIFLIIAIVQFIVIAKGAERVAEVGARFTLDALPGKQMSIDAELRAGIINKEESRIKRDQLQRESQLYGAMDGAMKFVKGDAIAGLLIALVNMIAGISIGVGMLDMAFGTAVSTYSILSIGDGLVSQIPSLFVSLAAGVLITRVSSDEQDDKRGLGQEIGHQVAMQPKALFVTAGVMALFMLVPGFPKLQFLGWALLFGIGGLLVRHFSAKRQPFDPMKPDVLHRDGIARPRSAAELSSELVMTYPVALRLAPELRPLLEDGTLPVLVRQAREQVTRRLGVPFPGVSLLVTDGLDAGRFVLLVNEIPATGGRVRDGEIFALVSHQRLIGAGIDAGQAVTDIEDFTTGCWLSREAIPRLDAAGIGWLDGGDYLGRALGNVLSRHAGEFVGLQEVKHLLAESEKAFPDLVAEVTRAVPLQRITEVLRRLVAEGVSVRNMRDILQALLEWAPKEKDMVMLTEHVRNALARQITYQANGGRTIHALTFDGALEDLVRAGIRSSAAGNFLAMDPEKAEDLRRRIIDRTQVFQRETNQRPAVLVSMDIRRYVAHLIGTELPDVPVLSYQNLSPGAPLVGFATLEG